MFGKLKQFAAWLCGIKPAVSPETQTPGRGPSPLAAALEPLATAEALRHQAEKQFVASTAAWPKVHEQLAADIAEQQAKIAEQQAKPAAAQKPRLHRSIESAIALRAAWLTGRPLASIEIPAGLAATIARAGRFEAQWMRAFRVQRNEAQIIEQQQRHAVIRQASEN